MKPLSDMTRLELAAFIGAEFKRRNINVVLSGGSCVSIYSQEKYVSMDLDFVNAAFTKRPQIVSAMPGTQQNDNRKSFQTAKHFEPDVSIQDYAIHTQKITC